MTLGEAITAVETSQVAYANAATQTGNDQAAADAIQVKLDAAKALVAADQLVQNDAAAAFNAALDALIAAATAAKLPI